MYNDYKNTCIGSTLAIGFELRSDQFLGLCVRDYDLGLGLHVGSSVVHVLSSLVHSEHSAWFVGNCRLLVNFIMTP